MIYKRDQAVSYAFKYGINPNPKYPFYKGDDCTNFVSQCLQAGGCKNHFHRTHPWWCVGDETSICWSVAASLYWYIRVCTQENQLGIKAKTMIINGNDKYNSSIADNLEIGDIVQYINYHDRIQHSAIITNFQIIGGLKEPLVTHHTFEVINIPWQKNHKKTIFHHITDIN